MLILRIVNLLDLPETLVGRIGDSLDRPLSFVIWIVLHWSLPFTILLIIPVIWFLSFRINNALLGDPVVRLLVLRVVHLLRLEDLPVVSDRTLVDLLPVNLHADCVVRFHHKSVEVRGTVIVLLVLEVGLLQDILAIIVEDEVRSLSVPALVWTKHDVVGSWVPKLGLVLHLWADFHIATTALDILLILGLVLDVELLALIAEGREGSRGTEELGVLSRLDSCVLLLILEPLSSIGLPLPLSAFALLPSALHPSALPVT